MTLPYVAKLGQMSTGQVLELLSTAMLNFILRLRVNKALHKYLNQNYKEKDETYVALKCHKILTQTFAENQVSFISSSH